MLYFVYECLKKVIYGHRWGGDTGVAQVGHLFVRRISFINLSIFEEDLVNNLGGYYVIRCAVFLCAWLSFINKSHCISL